MPRFDAQWRFAVNSMTPFMRHSGLGLSDDAERSAGAIRPRLPCYTKEARMGQRKRPGKPGDNSTTPLIIALVVVCSNADSTWLSAIAAVIVIYLLLADWRRRRR